MSKFHYVYTAPTEEERKEIVSIRKQYAPAEGESKLERLRRLDARVKNLPTALALTVGIASCLVFGSGLSLVLVWSLLWAGIPVVLLGGGGMCGTYPIYKWVLTKQKIKYGEEILALSEELLNEK